MLIRSQPTIRPATPNDLQKLASLIHFETYVHRHLDYRPPLDWVGDHPFPILEQDDEIVAALACPPDPPEVAWLRLFAVSSPITPEKAWSMLWPQAKAALESSPHLRWIAAIPMYTWFQRILKRSGFKHTHRIVLLSWEGGELTKTSPPESVVIRPMTTDDLPAVQELDADSFVPIWQNSRTYLEVAFRQAVTATVAEADGKLVGYQISTATPMGGHLARLAVHPRMQRRGIGSALLSDLLNQFARRGARKVTVNTQHDNQTSMALYQKAGFYPTGEEFPVYELDARNPA